MSRCIETRVPWSSHVFTQLMNWYVDRYPHPGGRRSQAPVVSDREIDEKSHGHWQETSIGCVKSNKNKIQIPSNTSLQQWSTIGFDIVWPYNNPIKSCKHVNFHVYSCITLKNIHNRSQSIPWVTRNCFLIPSPRRLAAAWRSSSGSSAGPTFAAKIVKAVEQTHHFAPVLPENCLIENSG